MVPQKNLWLDALDETVALHKLAGTRAVKHQAGGWERLTRRLLRRARRREHARLQNEYVSHDRRRGLAL